MPELMPSHFDHFRIIRLFQISIRAAIHWVVHLLWFCIEHFMRHVSSAVFFFFTSPPPCSRLSCAKFSRLSLLRRCEWMKWAGRNLCAAGARQIYSRKRLHTFRCRKLSHISQVVHSSQKLTHVKRRNATLFYCCRRPHRRRLQTMPK